VKIGIIGSRNVGGTLTPVDAGTLDESWRQQPEALVYGRSKDAAGVRAGLAAAVRR
jgi:hypothetical protein